MNNGNIGEESQGDYSLRNSAASQAIRHDDGSAGQLMQLVYGYIKAHPGATCHAIDAYLNSPKLSNDTGTLTELKKRGMIRVEGSRRGGQHNRIANCYYAVAGMGFTKMPSRKAQAKSFAISLILAAADDDTIIKAIEKI